MSDNKDVSPEMAAKIAAIKARMKGGAGASDGDAAPKAEAPADSGDGGGGDAPPAGDKAAQIAAIKARMAAGKSGGGGGGGSTPKKEASSEGDDGGDGGGGEDMQARIAALKAKVDSGRGKDAPAAAAATAAKKAPAKKGGAKNVFPVQPVNRKLFGDERLYGDTTVSKWFIISSLVLVVAVILMWARDHVRGWKPIQATHRERQIERLVNEIATAEAAVDPAVFEQVTADLEAAEANLANAAGQAEEIEKEIEARNGVYYASNQVFQIAKSEYEEMRYIFEEKRLMHGDDADLLADTQAEITEKQNEVAGLRLQADNDKLALDETKAQLSGLQAEVTRLGREKEGLLETVARLDGSLKKIGKVKGPDGEEQAGLIAGMFNELRNLPVVDMLAPTQKVEKLVLENLHDNYNFMYVDKIDMCITCHVSINDPYYSEWDPDNSKTEFIAGERVLNAHPRLDLFVADDSPHPMGQFGCTTCHQGRGQAVEFERTFHTPTADQYETVEEKTERWIEDYSYDPERHYWDWPMTPSDKLYSSCYQCHENTDRLPGVPEYNESRELVENLGCYGCHKIEGFEHLRKAGPDLTNLAAKASEEWSQKWAMDPRGFRPSTRMPHFWNLSNSGGEGDPRQTKGRRLNNKSDDNVDDWVARNEVEARAVIAYVYEQSQAQLAQGSFTMLDAPSGTGDPDQGRETFELRGCLGCHSVESEGWLENDHGPDLSAVGSKLEAQWLYSWIMEPKRYFETTVMPDLRLSEKEAWDVTAWLMSLRNDEWAAMPPPRADQTILGDIAVEQLASVAGDDWAKEEVAAMRAEGGERAVEVFVGEKLFNRFGCSGCHLVPGHYDDVGIGTELTNESLKELSKFDFGHEAAHGNPESVGHSRRAFYRHKLIDPRVYDRMPVIVKGDDGEPTISHYDQKVKLPGEKLKMPNYGLDDREVELLVQFLLGLRADGIDPSMEYQLTAEQALVEQGSRLITKYNCIGCHRMGQIPDRVEFHGDDEQRLEEFGVLVEEGMDYGVWMAQALEVGDTRLYELGAWLQDEYYDPEWEEDSDIFEFFEEDPENRPVPEALLVYGHGEGGMGQYIEEAAMRPPVFFDQGEKVNPDWLFEFLIEPYIVRTHVDVRMPTFGLSNDESLALVHWFSERADQPWPFVVDNDPVLDQELFDAGEAIFTEFQCNQCHPSGGVEPTNDPSNWGPDLGLAAERLKPGWIHDWLKEPQMLQPGTRMPNFLGTYRDNEYDPIYPDWEDKIRALQHYLKHMDQADS